MRPGVTGRATFSEPCPTNPKNWAVSFSTNKGGFPNKLSETGSRDIPAAPRDSAGLRTIREPVPETTRGRFPYLPGADVQLILSVRVILTAPFSPFEGAGNIGFRVRNQDFRRLL